MTPKDDEECVYSSIFKAASDPVYAYRCEEDKIQFVTCIDPASELPLCPGGMELTMR